MTGRDVVTSAYQDVDGTLEPVFRRLCDVSTQPFRLKNGAPVQVFLYTGFCENHQFGFSSSGTLRTTFTRNAAPKPRPGHDHVHP